LTHLLSARKRRIHLSGFERKCQRDGLVAMFVGVLMSFEYALESLEQRRLLAAVRLAVVGDFSATQATGDVANLVHSWNPSAIVTVGDNNYPDGEASTIDANIGQYYHDYIYPYLGTYGAGSPTGTNRFFPALGNHDWNDSRGAKPHTDYFNLPNNERYYSTQVGNVGIFVVDSEPQEPDGTGKNSSQANWIRNQMLNSTAKWKLVFFHHPAYSSGGMGSNSYMQWPFATWGATAVFAGHDHDYERLSEEGIPYFVDGPGGESIVGFGATQAGSQIRYAADYGAMRLDASDNAITFQFINRRGSVIDTYTIGTPTPPAAPSNLAASAVSATQINLSWHDGSADETGFKIQRSTDGVNFTVVDQVGTGVTSYSDINLLGGTQYYYRVVATNAAGDSTPTNIASATTLSSTRILGPSETWKYLDNGTDQGTAWRAINFSDTSWKSGTSELGYGDGDESTVVSYGSNPDNVYITTYFRKTFSIVDPSSIASLDLKLVRDDGAIVYLNGQEVFRSNMTAGSVNSKTLAASNIGGADESAWYSALASSSALVAGNNVIAVELHQSVPGSSDVSFNLQLYASGTSTPTIPAAPSGLVASPFSTSAIALVWNDNSPNETGFKIERSTDGVNFTQIDSVGANVATYNDSGLTSGQTYFYRVRAYNTAGNSAYTNVASSSPFTLPAAPSNLVATAGTNKIDLIWADNSNNESGFKIERSTDGVTFTQIFGNDDDLTSYSDVNVSVGTTYYYRVRATNPAGDSAYTNIASAKVSAPTGSVYLSDIPWTSATNGYGPVEKDTSNGSINAGDGRPITLNGVVYSKGLGVHADSQIVYNLGGAYSTFISDVGIDDEVLDTGTVKFQVLVDGVLKFDSGTMRATSVTQSINLDITGAQTLTLLVSDIGDGYTNDHADWAGARIIGDSTPPTAPSAPTGLLASATSTSAINLAWTDTASNESGFRVERSTDGVNFTPIGTVGANVTTYLDNGLSSGTQYWYRMYATNSVGDSAASNIASATTKTPSPAPTAPSSLTLTVASTTQINLAWTDNSSNETGFKIERSTDGVNFTQVATVGTNVKTYNNTGLSPGTGYFYRVRAYNGNGDSGYTNISAATTQTTSALIAPGSSWKYLDNGSNQGTAWRATSFNDSAWKTGNAQLGYGDGDEATVVSYGSNASSKYVTTYFRKAFTFADASQITSLTMQLIRDDGAVVYLNGTEIMRSNMTSSTISYTTLARGAIPDADESKWFSSTVPVNLLIAGTNVIAVEIHQSEKTSRDISFNFQLNALVSPPPPAVPLGSLFNLGMEMTPMSAGVLI
jgi:titin